MNIIEPYWDPVPDPQIPEDTKVVELASGRQGRFSWRILLLPDHKIYKHTYMHDTTSRPPRIQSVTWEQMRMR